MTVWVEVRAVIRSESEIEHIVKVDAADYAEWLKERRWTHSDENLRKYLMRDEEWFDEFNSRTLVEEELMQYEVYSAEEVLAS